MINLKKVKNKVKRDFKISIILNLISLFILILAYNLSHNVIFILLSSLFIGVILYSLIMLIGSLSLLEDKNGQK
ncbi:hypothetical protein EOM09_06475 [bacterium]|nr:hypothetical protein [bacterium]